ncbi:type II toxin-antitoxin system VapB family antitoxin [Streptomyces acidiscabies]|nr:type II toxin-antitoxin system VapB family antitoxin [Streptomyces acidiscabies]
MAIGLDDDELARAVRIGGGWAKEDVAGAALVAKHYRAAQGWDHEEWQRRHADDKQGGV